LKFRGLFCELFFKIPEKTEIWNFLCMGNFVDSVHGGLAWQRGWEATEARRSSVYSSPVLAGDGRGEGGQRAGLTTGLTKAQGATEWPGDEAAWRRPKACGGGALHCERGGKEGGVGCGKVRCGRGTLL
jgi:hypothetical protein